MGSIGFMVLSTRSIAERRAIGAVPGFSGPAGWARPTTGPGPGKGNARLRGPVPPAAPSGRLALALPRRGAAVEGVREAHRAQLRRPDADPRVIAGDQRA